MEQVLCFILARMATRWYEAHALSALTGTAYFMAPEVIKGEVYTLAADMWSFGCAVIEMLTGRPPYTEFEHQWAAMYHISHDDPQTQFPGVPHAPALAALTIKWHIFQGIYTKYSYSL